MAFYMSMYLIYEIRTIIKTINKEDMKRQIICNNDRRYMCFWIYATYTSPNLFILLQIFSVPN